MINKNIEFTFDDVLLLPRKSTLSENFKNNKFDLTTNISKNIKLNIPLSSAPMKNITETKMAVAIGKMGGIGFIHPYQNFDKQLEQIFETKLHHVKVGATIIDFDIRKISKYQKLLQSGADILLLDSAQAHSIEVFQFIKEFKKRYPKTIISAGVVVTKQAVLDLIHAGADNIRVGIGAGSHCTTRLMTAIGRPQLSAIKECADVAIKYNIPIISDGGIRNPADIVKALVFGADSVMIGGLFAGTDEASSKVKTVDKKKYKISAGSTTYNALKPNLPKNTNRLKMSNDVFEEGITSSVTYCGSLSNIIRKLLTGVTRAMWYQGVTNIEDLKKYAKVIFITPNSVKESYPVIYENEL
jgi:IMP dehydrogenase